MSAKTTSLQRSITRSAVSLIIIVQLITFALAYGQLTRFRDDFASLRHTDFAMGVQDEITRQGASRSAFQRVAQSAVALNPGIRVLFVDGRGAILESEPTTEGSEIPYAEIQRSLNPALPKDTIRLRTRDLLGYDAGFSAAPGIIEGRSGVLLILLPEMAFSLWTPAAVAFLLLLLGGLAAVCIVRTLVRSQLRGVFVVSNAARRYLQSGALTRAPLLAPGEVNDLGQRFNQLADGSEALQARIEATEAERRKLLAGLVHDLGAPVTSLVGFVTLAKESLARAELEQARDHLHRVLRATDRLTPLIQNLGKLGELELERLQPRFAPVDLSRLVDQAIETLLGAARRKGVTIDRLPQVTVPIIEGDEELLSRVVENLLSNAIRFTAAGGRITLGVERHAGHLTLLVSDTGVGIAPELCANIFEEYVQGAAKGEGVGLGLALAKRFVEVHQGRIKVESRLGVGSTFRVELPISHKAVTPPPAPVTAMERRAVEVRLLVSYLLGGAVCGLLPLTLGEPPRAHYSFLGFALGSLPLLSLRLCQSLAARIALLTGLLTAFVFALSTLRRPELVLLGVAAALVITLPFALTLVRSFALGIATRIGYALIASSLLSLLFAAAGMWFSVQAQRGASLRERSAPLLQETLDLLKRGYAEHEDLERALYSFQTLAPLLGVVLLEGDGGVLAQSLPENEFARVERVEPPLSGQFGQQVVIDELQEHSGGGVPAVVGSLNLDRAHRVLLLLDNRRSVQLGRMLFESSAFRFLSFGSAAVICAGVALAFAIQRLIRPRLAYAFELLRREPPRMLRHEVTSRRCDEIDEILTALTALTESISNRERELAEVQRRRCDLIARVYHSLEEPLEELRFQLADGLKSEADLGRFAKSLDRIAQIVDAEQALLQELNEYARTAAQSLSDVDDLYRVDELLQDIVVKLKRAGRRISLHSSGAAPFVSLHLGPVHRVLQFAITARLTGQRESDELVCEVIHAGAQIVIALSGPVVASTHERGALLFAEIRHAIVEGYLDQLGGRISEGRKGDCTRTEITLPAA